METASPPSSEHRLSGGQRVGFLSSAMAVTAGGLYATVVSGLDAPVDAVVLPGVLLAVVFWLTETFVVHLQLRRQTQSFSLSEVPLVLGLFFVSPAVLLIARLVGSTVALVGWRRQPLVKAGFNVGYFALDTAVLLLVFHVILGSGEALGPRGWFAAHMAGAIAIVVGSAAVAAAIWLTERSTANGLLRGVVSLGLPTAFVNVNLGLVAVTVLVVDLRAAALLLCLTAALFFFYRSHTHLRVNHEALGELYAVTRVVDESLERGGAVQALLERTADLMRAETADLVLSDGRRSVRSIWHAGEGRLTTEPGEDLVRIRQAVLGGEPSVILSGKKDREPLRRLGGHEDALLFGLVGDGQLNGSLMVADRLGNVSTFTEDDQRLFEALGNHASIALRNSALLERLRVEIVEREHEALHDALTGLPNRTLFDRWVTRALRDRPDDAHVIVMLIDLDRFKEVNDTLGHQHGDRLLQEVGSRIAAAVGNGGFVARLGGDEFAVLLPTAVDRSEAVVVAQRIQTAVDRSFDLDSIPIVVGASIGIAACPGDADDAESLLQRADVAMYTAKKTAGIELYHPDANHYSPERLAMVAELRRAIDRDELLVEYQPCIDLATGRVVAVEALARWHHPEHGYVPPDTFIVIAERSGLIGSLTSCVLRTAIRQGTAWREDGLMVRVAVNLSARSLLDEDLPAEIAQHLADARLPATSLVLEITESSIIADPGRTIGMLNKLSSMGITLSIDDYGTGYSSLSYLKHLPVDELKLDRSFVTGMLADHRDAVIVRNTVDLAHELDLRVVAEGVEDAATRVMLTELGCDLAQGYHICRPRTASQLQAFATELHAAIPLAAPTPRPLSLADHRLRSTS